MEQRQGLGEIGFEREGQAYEDVPKRLLISVYLTRYVKGTAAFLASHDMTI